MVHMSLYSSAALDYTSNIYLVLLTGLAKPLSCSGRHIRQQRVDHTLFVTREGSTANASRTDADGTIPNHIQTNTYE